MYIAPTPAPRLSQPKPVASAIKARRPWYPWAMATIHLACINAPETSQGESGTQVTLVLKQLLGNGPIEICLLPARHHERELIMG